MKKDVLTRDLEAKYRQALFSVRLPDAVLDPTAPPFVKDIDLAFARALLGDREPWGGEDIFAASDQLVREVMAASPEGRQLFLAAELDLLNRARETGKDFVHEGPFGMKEAVYPIALRGHVVHLVRSGKYRTTPFADAELSELAFLAGRPAGKLESAAALVPVLTDSQAAERNALHRRLRDAQAAALEQNLRSLEMSRSLLEAEHTRSLGVMAQGMAHHLNNLLTTILGYASLVADKSALQDDLGDAIRRVAEAAQKGRRFTEEMLALSESDNEPETPTAVHDRIQGVLTLLQNRAARVHVETQLLARRDVVMGPPGLVQQIVFHLLAGALDSLPDGGQLSISTANGKDETDGRDLLHLEVTETPSAKKANGRKSGGTPLAETSSARVAGLFGLVSRVEGTVNAAALEHGGSRIVVTLPAVERAAVGPRKKMRRRLAPSRIWVADDDPVVREMCRRVLSEDGHTVDEIESGVEARAKLEKPDARPDLLVYDFNMPDCSGLEFCRRAREDGIRTPVLLLGGFKPEQSDVQEALKLRKVFYLQKPFSFRDMADMVTIALGDTLIEE